MNETDHRAFDLNLLVVFDVLMAERSVTRAAERLGRTQSAISHSLSRLRDQLGDPLLLKAGTRMHPTAFALDFLEQTRPILRSIQRALSRRGPFDPANSRRIFRLAAPDFASSVFMALLTSLQAEGSGIALEWTGPRATMLLDVAEGLTDVAIIPAQLKLPDGVVAREIGALQWRCFGRKGHPAFDEWGPDAWSSYPHLVVRVGDQLESPVNIAASAAVLERTIACWVPNFSAIAPVLAATDLLATVPSLAMADTPSRYGLEYHPVPFSIAPLPHALLWSAARAREPEIEWLIERLWPVLEREFGDPMPVPRDHSAHRRGLQTGNGS